MEIDARGTVLKYAIVSPPYVRRWPAGRAFVLLKQPPVTSSAPATYWRAEWDDQDHGLEFRPEAVRGRLPACRGESKATEIAAGRLILPKLQPWTALVTLAQDESGACVRGVAARFRPGQGGLAELRAEGGALRGRVWMVKPAARRHPQGGMRPVPQIIPADVTCEIRAPGSAT